MSLNILSAQQKQINIVPNPQKVVHSESYFEISDDISINFLMGNASATLLIEEQIKEELKQIRGYDIISKESISSKRIRFALKGRNSGIDELIDSEEPKGNKRFKEEGYILKSTPESITIASYTERGLFYGAQSLKQLIRGHNGTFKIPSLTIIDWPDLEIRGMMDDISRGPVPHNDFIKQQIERFSEMKINMLTYYTQDVVKTKSHPNFAPEGGALSIEEWKELADYAKKYHIDLVGNFQSFGHFDQILKHEEYAHLGESETLLSPAFDESYELLEDIYREMIPAFHSDYFHINSDETFDLGTGASKAMVDSLGEGVVYANHIKRIHKIITGMGKKIMMWGDIALEHPEVLDLLPKDIIMVTWGYDIMDDYAPRIKPFKEKEYKLLVSTGILNSFSVMPDFNVARGNIGGFMEETVKQDVWGMLNTVWDDGGFALFSRDWYGVYYAADQSWKSNPDDKTYDERFSKGVFGASNTGYPEAIHILNELAGLKSTEKMNEDVLWDKVIPESGEQVLVNIQDWSKVLDITKRAQAKLDEFNPQSFRKDIVYIQHIIDLYRYMATSRPDIVNAARLYREAKSLEEKDPNNTRKKLVEVYNIIRKSYSELERLKAENQYLWLSENRVYAIDRIISKYDAQIKDLDEVKSTIEFVIHEMDKTNKIPSIDQVRLDIIETEGWYFQGWLMCQPFANPMGFSDPKTDHLDGMKGIENTFPNVTEEFFYNDNKYRWRRVNTPYFAKVDLDEIHGKSENQIGYAFAHIDIKEDRNVRALVGSSDGVEVYLNGKRVHKNFIQREFELDQDEMTLPLKKGRNHLMIRVTNEKGDWAFSFRLPDSEMRSYKNRYKIID